METNKTTTIPPQSKQKIRYLPIVMIIFGGILFSLFAYKVLVKWDDQRIRLDFQRSAENRYATLEREIKFDLQVLLSLQALYSSHQDIKRSQFRDFVNPLLSQHSSIQALEWIPRVTNSDRGTYEAAAKEDGLPAFQITEREGQGKMVRAVQREEYFPVYYVEPYKPNKVALGFDLASNPTRREALDQSRDTGEMIATSRIKLVQETAGQFGFLVFAPIYRKDAPIDSIPARRSTLKGFVLGVFRTGDIMERSLTYLQGEGIDIDFNDKSAPKEEQFLYAHPSSRHETTTGQISPPGTTPVIRLEYAKTLDMAGRKWEMRFTATPDYVPAKRSWLPGIVLSGGLLFTTLLTVYLIINLNRTRRIERIVKERTKELREVNEMLSSEISVRRQAEGNLQKALDALDIRVKERTAELLNTNEQLREEIADRTRVEAELRESEKKYRQVVENAAEVIYTTDAKGNFTYGNSAGLRITGYSLEEFQGLNYLDLVLPEHRQRVTDVYIGQFRQRQPTSYLEFPFFAKSGKVIWFAQNASLVIENGRVAGFHIIARDITERKRAEEALRASEDRYRSVFEGAGEGILVADIESKQFMYANPAICRILGYAAEELTRLGVADIHPREALDQVVAEFEAQARGEKILSAELPCLRKDGSVIYVDITTAILVIDGRKCNVGFFTDVTKRKQAEEALRESERAARQLANENAVMAEIGRIIGSTLNIHEVYERFAEEMRKLIHFDRISVNLINPGEKTFTIPYTTGTHVPDRESGDVIPLAGTRAEWVRQNRSSLLIMKANRSKAMRDFPGLLPVFEAGIRSTMSVPLMSEGQVIGVLNLQSMAENAYRPTDVKLAERVSAQIAEAIANAQLFSERNRAAEALRESAQAAQHLAQENAVMAEVGRIISSTLNTDEVYELFAAEVRKLIPCDKMSINLVDHGKGRVTLAYVTGMPVPGRNARDSFPLAGSLTGEGIRTSGGIFYHPQSADEVAGRYPDLLPVFQSGLQSMMIVPVISKDQAIAALQFMTGRPNAYTEDHLRLGLKVANQIAGAIANAQLFLERKRAEEALREREERYRTILETMEEGYYEVDLQGRFTLFNEALSNMHGFSKEEMLGMPYKKYMSTEMAQKVYKVFNGVYKTGQPLKLSEWEIIRADGEKVFMEASVYLVKNAQGEKIGFRGIERDITVRKQMEEQLKRSEEHFRSLIESSSDIITRIDSQQNIRYASPSVERVLGYKPEDYIGQNLFHFIHPDDLKSTIAALTQGLQNAGVAISIEHRVKHKNGSWLFFQTIGKGLLDDFGNRLVVASSRDVTERKNLESQLVQAQKLESIGQLAAGIAHEINTPTQYVGDNTRFFQEAFNDLLRLIGKYEHLSQAVKTGAPLDGGLQEIDAIAKEIDLDYLTGEVPKAIQQTLEGVERVRNIVQAMKEFSHPGTKEKTPINLNKAIQNTITVARNEWKYVAEMATDFDSSLPLVSGLPGELNQVILNLIINAAHAIADVVGDGSKGKGTITVSTRLDGNWAEIRVSDTGTGIPENIRSRIFDPFFTTKKVGKGTGQGLTISHSVIVDKHGGTIHFDTAMGKGTTFITRLPIGDTVGS